MVLLSNIVIGQRVEVKYEGKICKGTVRYKGGVGNRPGEWVGVELDAPGQYGCSNILYVLSNIS
jgi:dynactin complex subunit